MNKEEKSTIQANGITLISLVITIIILLILAAVVINLAVDSNGLLKKTGDVVNKWNVSVAEEQTNIDGIIDKLEDLIPIPDASGANAPIVPAGANIKYVTWEADEQIVGQYNEVLSDTKPKNWYNYDLKQWANIKTTGKTANEDGTYNEAYWVWIPRYAYQVPEKPTETTNEGVPTFKIAFLQDTGYTPVDSSVLGGATIKTDTSSGVNPGDWVVHPAFQFGDTPLSGIWVAKYKASSNAPNTVADGGGDTTEYQVNVKPSVPSWISIQVTNSFDVCRNMTAVAGALEGSTTSDPHMMKNVEWGAVAYLSQSRYGKNGKVWNNPYFENISTAWNDTSVSVSDNDIVLTGMVATTAGANATNTTECDSYNTGNGPEASTTGNVYGIYDMVCPTSERTAAYLNNSNAQSSTDITSVRTAAEDAETAKYVDVYSVASDDTEQTNYEANADKYGDAVYETSYQWTRELILARRCLKFS